MTITIPRLTRMQPGPTGAVLRRLFDRCLGDAFHSDGSPPDYREADPGEIEIWLAHCRTLVVSMPLEPSMRALRRIDLARTEQIDVLTLDLSRPGSVVACDLDLFAPDRIVRNSFGPFALWLGANGAPAIVPQLPLASKTAELPSFRVTPHGLVTVPAPYNADAGWLSGVLRGIVATVEARTGSTRSMLEAVR